MRAVGRTCLVVMLICGMVNFPAMAANEKPLGSIIQADKALLGNADAGYFLWHELSESTEKLGYFF